MDKLTAIKIKYDDGTYSDEIPVSVLSENVEWDSTHTLVDVLGSIDVDVTGTIQDQISQLFNEKVSASAMQDYVTNSMPTYITNWLNTNVNPVGSAVVVDSSLTVSGAAADAKAVGDNKIDKAEWAVKAEYIDGVIVNGGNLFDTCELFGEKGYARILNGKLDWISAPTTYANYNGYLLPVEQSTTYSFTGVRFWALIDADKETVLSEQIMSNVTMIGSMNASYIYFSFNNQTYPIETYKVVKGTNIDVEETITLPEWLDPHADDIAGLQSDITGLQSDITRLQSDINGLDTEINNVNDKIDDLAQYPNLANPALNTPEHYMDKTGRVWGNNALFYTGKISVEAGQTIKANHKARFITAFTGETADSEKGVDDQSGGDTLITYTVPEGIDGLVFSFKNEYANDLMIYVYDGVDYDYVPYGKIVYLNPDILPKPLKIITSKENRPISKEISGVTFATNTFISLPVFSCTRKNTRLIFHARIGSLGNFEIGFITAANSGGTKYNRFQIMTNEVRAYLRYDYPTSAMIEEVVDHNLNISSGSLQIIIEEHPNATCTITIENNGNRFKHTFEGYVKNNTLQPYCYSAYGLFSKYKFVWSCTDLGKNIWIFGDSYMAYSIERWTYYLEEYGYAKNALFNSFPGAGSNAAITALNNLIAYGNPKHIVWAMGMNDGSDSESAPSNAWATRRDTFISVCDENDIEPIFCTIPTVPTVNNEQKNAWIKTSGYRYIDFARAVNASASGVWDNETLSGDGVHPTANGAKALFAELLLDFPEIMQGLDGVYPPIIPEKIGDNTEKKLVFNADTDNTVTWTNW